MPPGVVSDDSRDVSDDFRERGNAMTARWLLGSLLLGILLAGCIVVPAHRSWHHHHHHYRHGFHGHR
jgi:hypothetical protein